MSTEAMNHAIDVLKDSQDYKMGRAMTVEAVEALEEALVKQDQDWSLLEATQQSLREHMAMLKELQAKQERPDGGIGGCVTCGAAYADQVVKQEQGEPVAEVTSATGAEVTMSWWHEPALPIGTKLYTTPQQRTWVGLTDDEMDAESSKEEQGYGFVQGALWAEAKLKEKNNG